MKLTLKVLTRRYTNVTYIFMFEINPLKVVIIWFIKGSQSFLNTHKKNIFLQNTNNFHIFEPKVVALMSHVI
jgi:hypothetical protein